MDACKRLSKSEEERLTSVIEEAYFTILASMPKEKTTSFALQREKVNAKLSRPIDLSNLKRLGVGIMAAVMIFTMSACNSYEKRDMKSGFIYVDKENTLSSIEETTEYYLVKLDGYIYLTKAIKRMNYYVKQITETRLYDITKSGKKFLSVGSIFQINGNRIKGGVENVNNTLLDYDFFDGQYGFSKILPADSYINLSTFVSSDKPSKEDLMS